MGYAFPQRDIDRDGLDSAEAWNKFSCDDASSLLRILSFGNEPERTYTSVSVVPVADGRELFVLPH